MKNFDRVETANFRRAMIQAKTAAKQFDRLLYDCPGAWYGNAPLSATTVGNLTVAIEAAHRAAAFIERSRNFRVAFGDAFVVENAKALVIPIMRRS